MAKRQLSPAWILSNNETSLTANSGALLIGLGAAAQHLSIDADEIQSKTNGTTAGVLNLNPHGGLVNVGTGGLSVAGATFIGDELELGATLLVNDVAWFYSDVNISNKLTAASVQVPSLVANSGSVLISDPAGVHLAFGGNDIQAKSNGTTATTLDLNPLGGNVTVGGRLIVADTEATLSPGSGAIQIGADAANNLRLDQNEIQASAAGVATPLILNPHGGVVRVIDAPVDPTDVVRKTELDLKAASVQGTYTPTLTGLSVGTTGATNNGFYHWIGGPNVGDTGILVLWGQLIWGTAGTRTFPSSSSRIAFPSGFAASDSGVYQDVGTCTNVDTSASAGSKHILWLQSTTTLRPIVIRYDGTYNGNHISPIAASVPFIWADTDQMVWRTSAISAVRV